MAYKPCKVTLAGEKYMVNKFGVVARILGADDVLGTDDTRIQFCDSETTAHVLAEVKRLRHNRNRRVRDSVMRDCGLVKVRGALGGTYWE